MGSKITTVFTGPPCDIGFHENPDSEAPVQHLLGVFCRSWVLAFTLLSILLSASNALLPLYEAEPEHNTDIDYLTMNGLLTCALVDCVRPHHCEQTIS
jgi:hypothetical protein